ncbi:xanthine dehydrogenase family protein molybdopterin-binding subunit [Sphingomonas sanxanigenens]|uniref:Aldehyde oxidase/xanthine dehydrogenase a/b hammerhead domain-containing protein n=1 Tax=Sphingomonas sanxanigenens DSM 19645 = NX02 TaxID=1123269 RepID=W0AMS4_9SPHN|nr:molybdopterin cofactor-binding domain-containing protein [Sphingomonas sanxanigenens]AHE56975.1 hypothetical protein NX02_26930 [Sphingomonas sanxanigenens DSM 19645 = NX02]
MAAAPPLVTSRRTFLAAAAALAGDLVIGVRLSAAAPAAGGALHPNAFVRIDRAGLVTVIVPYAEIGQGSLTSAAMLVAEELEVEPGAVRTEHAPGDDTLYGSPVFGEQITGGSASLGAAWKQLRAAGAAARIMLIEAAAKRWSVAPSACAAEGGRVLHPGSGRSLSYGALVQAASALPVPKDPPLKTGNFRVIGTSARRTDTPGKVDGSAIFGLDVRLPGMRYAAVAACPVIGGRLKSVDDAPALAVAAVTQVVRLPDAVAVIAAHTGAARKGLAALAPIWEGGSTGLSTADLVAGCDAALERQGLTAHSKGDAAAAMKDAAAQFEAVYRMPMLAHAAMEPLNATVHARADRCDVWVGSQVPGRARREVAAALKLPPEKVSVTNHLVGGGFGRRLQSEWIVQAALIARQVDAPVKVMWSRDEDMRHGSYRYHNHSRIRVGLDAAGNPLAFEHRIVGPAIMAWFLAAFFKDGIDLDVTNSSFGPYQFPNVAVDFVRNDPPPGLLAGNWRGVGETRNGFAVEVAMDELAARAKQDPVAYRRRLLAPGSRILNVLDRLAAASGWGNPLPTGSGRGVAILSGFGSHVGLVAEVQVAESGRVKVTRITCAIDCGQMVNPNIVRQQIEGGVLFGLSMTLYGRITMSGGQIEQSNFHDYPVVRMNEVPEIEVVLIENREDPGGVGEPGTTVVAPAVVNAIFAATGRRLRSLPLEPAMTGLSA